MTNLETPQFFSTDGVRLFGVFHGAASPARLPILFCHPFGEEKLWTHRVFVTFARELAKRGHPVLRFDYMGNGDSAGDFAASTVETVIADINRAAEWLKRETGQPKIGMMGLRFGATVATVAAEHRDDVARLIQWAPIVDGAKYLQELLRINLSTQLAVYREVRIDREAMAAQLAAGATVNVDGYELSPGMAAQLQALRIDQPKRFNGDCFIAQVDKAAEPRPLAELSALTSTYAQAQMQIVREDPFWKEIPRLYESAPNLFDATLRWLGH